MIKKINAVLSLMTDLLLAAHMWVMTYSLFTGWYDSALCPTLAVLLCVTFSAHAILTIGIFFFCHSGAEFSCKKENIGMIMQRIEGILMLLLIHSHTNSYRFLASGSTLTYAQAVTTGILETVLVLVVTPHAALSTPKALLSLGLIKTERARTVLSAVFGGVFGLSGIAAIVAVIRFFAGI